MAAFLLCPYMMGEEQRVSGISSSFSFFFFLIRAQVLYGQGSILDFI